MSSATEPKRQTNWLMAFKSWRVGAVALLSFSSGLPYGVVAIAMPVWLKQAGFDVKSIGLLMLVQVPWGFKFLWSPVLDRVRLPMLGRRRGWILATQLALAVGIAALAAQVLNPSIAIAAGLMLMISFSSASQDIVYDAYAVEVLHQDEHGAAVGIRSGVYIAGMRMAGNLAISLSGVWGWSVTLGVLAAIMAALVTITLFAPEPEVQPKAPQTFRAAVWEPFVGFLGRPRALEITAFVALFRMTDSLAGALVGPFLIEKGYDTLSVGVYRGAFDFAGSLVGGVLGSLMIARLGVTRSLWIGGVLQAVSNLGYAALAVLPVSNWYLSAALAVETATGGMGWGAFGVLLLRLTDRRFSATQYALFSSLVGLTRTLMGPVAGVLVDSLGWRDFFVVSMLAAVPGLALLSRFAPWGSNPAETSGEIAEVNAPSTPWPTATLWGLGALGWVLGACLALGSSAAMTALKHWRTSRLFDFGDSLWAQLTPQTGADALGVAGAVIFGLLVGVATAAALAARGRPHPSA